MRDPLARTASRDVLRGWPRTLGALFAVLAALLGLAWLGLSVPPRRFRDPDAPTRDLGRTSLPGGLSEQVYLYLAALIGERPPIIRSAVVWGRGRVRVGRFSFPARFRSRYVPGQSFERSVELTWFGLPVARAEDVYRDGQGRTRLTGLVRRFEAGPHIDQAQNLALWAESLWAPSALADPRLRWEIIDEATAWLRVPFGPREDRFLVRFDPQAGLILFLSGLRYRGHEPERTPWRVEYRDWRAVDSIMVPSRLALIWEDEGRPAAMFHIDGVAYNGG